MIIECPECHMKISDQSEKCIHCGYPLNKLILDTNICIINGKECDLGEELDLLTKTDYMQGLRKLRDKSGLELADVVELGKIIKETKKIPSIYNSTLRENHRTNEEREKYSKQNTPKCPKCGSASITAGQRGYSVLTGFLGSSKTMNRCANCGYKWKPKG